MRKCLDLLPQEKDLTIRTNLADALLGQFADEGFEPVRALVQRRAYDDRSSDLMRRLIAVSTVVGATFPRISDLEARGRGETSQTGAADEENAALLACLEEPYSAA